MPRWGRPPGARAGRHTRGRGQWDEMARVEEVESEDEYGRQVRKGRAAHMRQLEYGGRGARRRSDYEDMTDETASVDGGDYDLYDHGDSTVAYAVQLAMRDKEDQLVDNALERIRRAQMLGQKNVRLSQRELDALERKRQQTDNLSEARRLKYAKDAVNARSSSRRHGGPPPETQAGPYPQLAPAAHGRPSSSSAAPRPRTPTMQSLRPQQSNSPLRPPYSGFPERLPPGGRPQSMYQPMYGRPLPDDPQWAPPFYNPMQMNPYPPDQVSYQPQLPTDLRIGPQSRMSYPAGMSPIQAQHRQSFDGRQMRGTRPAESETESEQSSEEEEEDDSEESSEEEEEEQEEEKPPEEEDDEVQIVRVVERSKPSGLQRRIISGGARGRARRNR